MPDRDEQQFGVRPVVPGRSGRGAWAAPAVVAGVLVALIVVGRFGGSPPPAQSNPTTAPTTGRPSPAAIAAPTLTPAIPLAPTPGATTAVAPFAAARLNIHLVRSSPVPEVIVELSDRRTLQFVYSRVNLPPSLGAGLIEVAVGTRAAGAAVRGSSGRTVYGTTLEELESSYRRAVRGVVAGSHPAGVGTDAGVVLEVGDVQGEGQHGATTILLALHGGRAFVITVEGFDAGSPAVTTVARHRALQNFVLRLAFEGPPLFSSSPLGFEAVAPLTRDPVVVTVDRGRAGYVAFEAGSSLGSSSANGAAFGNVIRVDVGSLVVPAQPAIRPLPGSSSVGLWTGDQDRLEEAFFERYGPGTSAIRTTVAGERGLRIAAPGDAGAAVVIAHRGRVYIITSIGPPTAQSMASFDAFLADFRFLP